MGGLSDSNPSKRGRRGGLRWPGSKSENIGKIVLGGEVGPDSTAGEIADTVELRGIGFTKLDISSAIDGLGTLLGDLELLELGREDVGSADRLIVIEKHDPAVDGRLKRNARRVEGILGSIVGSLEIRLIKSGGEKAVFSDLDVRTGLGGGFPRDVNEDGAGPAPDNGRTRVRGFANPDRGKGR
jgi:hypothetical protein